MRGRHRLTVHPDLLPQAPRDSRFRIGELDPTEKATADLLVDHETALRSFARSELAGAGDSSLEQIIALPHMQ